MPLFQCDAEPEYPVLIMRELLTSLGVLLLSLAALGWLILRVVEWSSRNDFKAIERAMKNEQPRSLTKRIGDFAGAAYYRFVAWTHRARLKHTGELWRVEGRKNGVAVVGFGDTPFEAWADYQYSYITEK
jgi:hypothetical protein